MSKMILFSFVLILSASTARAEVFVNPMFNQPLQPYSRRSCLTEITPYSQTIMINGTIWKETCTLIKNEMSRVVLKCTWRGVNSRGKEETYTNIQEFVVEHPKSKFEASVNSDIIMIRNYIYNEAEYYGGDKDGHGRQTFLIPKDWSAKKDKKSNPDKDSKPNKIRTCVE